MAIAHELDAVLGLGVSHLQRARAKVIEGLIERLRRKYGDGKTWKREALQRELVRWTSREAGEFQPFCQVAAEFLRIRLRRASG